MDLRGGREAPARLVARRAIALACVMTAILAVGLVTEPGRPGRSGSRPLVVTLGSAPTALSFVQMRHESRGLLRGGGTLTYEVETTRPEGSSIRTVLSSTKDFTESPRSFKSRS